ncbi:MAG: exodeoxyribonuclease VII large subunit [Brumimicrobium sp.]
MSENRNIFTLTKLNRSLENLFWEKFSQSNFWITAEISKTNQKNGHWYIELVDSVDGKVTAKSRATIWSTTFQSIAERIGVRELVSILQDGNNILMSVKIEYHKIYGLSLRIQDIDPNYSYGEIERKRQEVIKKLKTVGIFDNQKKVHLPLIIKRIALIGSPNTSGYRDFLNELFNNYDFNNFKIKEFPVRVQGQEAVSEIVNAIHEANLFDAEVIVILRGGGSKIDLALFDDYLIAEAICHSHLPVLTGIGHETDEVVADLVARQYFITPTAVGQHIQYGIQSFKEIMRDLHDRTIHKAQQLVGESRTEFSHYNNYLSHFAIQLIHSWRSKFRDIEFEVLTNSKNLLFTGKDFLYNLSHSVSFELNKLVQQNNNELDYIMNQIQISTSQNIYLEKELNLKNLVDKTQLLSLQFVEKERVVINTQAELLALLNPLKILLSGYTISTINNQDVKDVDIKVGDEMKTLSSRYIITSKIIAKEENTDGNN